MSARRKNGQLRKLRHHEKAKTAHNGLMVAHSIADAEHKSGVNQTTKKARYYRGPNGLLVVWRGGKFRLRPADPKLLNTLAPCPSGLKRRVNEAIRKGQTRG